MDNEAEYRIEYQIIRRRPSEEDFTEIGYGSTGACSGIGAALRVLESYVTNGLAAAEGGESCG